MRTMSPAEFIEALSRHYGKRHESPGAAMAWLKEMVDSVKHTDHQVLAETYRMIREQYEERAFPLPATLRKYTERAAQIIHPEHKTQAPGQHGLPVRCHRAPDTPEQQEIYRLANEWQHWVHREYGNWAGYWRATKHMRREEGMAGRASPEKPIPELPVANRDYFAKLPKWNAGSLSDVTKRMTGDRE